MDRYNQIINEAIWGNISKCAKKTAVVIGSEEQTYGELGIAAEQVAEQIASYLSSQKLDALASHRSPCIGVCIERNRYLIPSVLALFRLGITYVPLTPQLPAPRIEYIARDCNMSLILTTSNLVDRLPAGVPYLAVDALDSQEPADCPPLSTDNSTAYIIYTSGTTGTPKGVVIPYQSMQAFLSVLDRPELTNISPDSRVLLFASINFDASIIELFGTLYYGATMIVASEEERTNAKLLYKLMITQRVTYCLLSPSLMAVFPSFDFPDMEGLFVGGEPMVPSVNQRALGHQYRFVNVYGPTENTVYSTMRLVTPDVSLQNIGHTFPGIQGYVFDEDLRPVKVGEVGELMLGGAQLSSGYLNQSELTQEAFIPNPIAEDADRVPTLYHTGDLVRLMPDGSYDYVGRKDSQVKIHSYRIELGEIKSRIEQCPDVVEAFVRIEDVGSDKQLVAYVQTIDGKDREQVIRQELNKFLPYYMIPHFYVFLKEFPLNINGKIDKAQLVNTRLQAMTHNDGPVGPEEEVIKSVVSRIMGLDDVNIDTDLIDELGLTSLQIMQATMSLDFTGFYVSAKDFVTNRTIREIAANHKSQPCYWYNKPDKSRPTMIIVSGYTSFVFLYPKWVKTIEDKYSIFVIESYHDTSEKNILDYETFIERYYDMVKDIVDEYGCDIITGFCLGGEMGLYLAHKIAQRKHLLPHVVVLDGEVDRDPDYRQNTPIFNFPDFTPEINEQRYEQDMTIVETTPDFHYQGCVTSILSANYNAAYSDQFQDLKITKEQREAAYGYFKRAGRYWQNRYPDCELLYIDTDHDHYLLDETSINYLTDYFTKLRVKD